MSFLSGVLADAKELEKTLGRSLDLQLQIKRGLNEMSEKGQELKDLIAGIGTDVAEIDGDLQEVIDKANEITGLPTTAEWDEIKSGLTGIKGDTAKLAAKVPEPETPSET